MSVGAVCVAVVEDDLALGQLIVDVLEGAQLSARWFKRGQDFLQACLAPSLRCGFVGHATADYDRPASAAVNAAESAHRS